MNHQERRTLVFILIMLAVGVAILAIADDVGAATATADTAPSAQIARAAFPDACEPVSYVDVDELPDGAVMWATVDRCEIAFAPGAYTINSAARCTLLVHEFGHLAGLNHSDDPTSIMYGPGPQKQWPACAERFRLKSCRWHARKCRR